MTHLEPEDILRRALREAAGSVEPAADGLSQIRARLSPPRPLFVAWLVAAWETVSQFVMLRLEPALAELGPRLGTALQAGQTHLEPVTERLRPAVVWLRRMIKPKAGSDERPRRYGWVRPVIAMAIVVLVAVAGGLTMSGLSSQIARDGLNIFSGQTNGSGGGGTHTPGVTGGGQHYQPTSGTSSTSGTAPGPAPSGSQKAKATPKATPSPSASTSSPSPSPSPSPSTSSPSPPTSPSPSPTDSGEDTGQPSTNNASQST